MNRNSVWQQAQVQGAVGVPGQLRRFRDDGWSYRLLRSPVDASCIRTMALLVGWGLLWISSGYAGERSVSPEQIETWIEQLGAADFDAREQAEKELLKTGASVLSKVQEATQSNDAEIRIRSGRIVDKLKWLTIPDISDPATILPPSHFFFMSTSNAKDLITRIRKETALGRLYDRDDLAAVWNAVREMGLRDLELSPDQRKIVAQWPQRFGGPSGISFKHHESEEEDRGKLYQETLFVGIDGALPQAAMADLRKLILEDPDRWNSVPQIHRGVTCDFDPHEKWGLGLVKNLIVFSSSKPAMLSIIDAASDEKQRTMFNANSYKEASSKVPGDQLGKLFFNMQSFSDTDSRNRQGSKMVKRLGLEGLKSCIVTLGLEAGLFVEQAFYRVDGNRRGLAKLISLEPVTGRLGALCPPDALCFVCIPVEGATVYKTLMGMLRRIDPRSVKRFEEQLPEFDRQLKVNVVDSLAGCLKGEVAAWLLRPDELGKLEIPEVCMAIETVDAAAAMKAADMLAKLLPLVAEKKGFIGKADYQGRTCYFMRPLNQLNSDPNRTPADAMVDDRTFRIPPKLFCSWCADGARILISQRQEALQRMIQRSAKQKKGMDAQPGFQRLLSALSQDERGGLVYANTDELMTWAYAVGLPMLIDETRGDLKAQLKKVPKNPKALMGDSPGTLLSLRGTPNGVRVRAVGDLPMTIMLMTYLSALVMCDP